MNRILTRYSVSDLLDSLELYSLSEYDLSGLAEEQAQAAQAVKLAANELASWQGSKLFEADQLADILDAKQGYLKQAKIKLSGLNLVERVAAYQEALPLLKASIKACQFLALAQAVQEGIEHYWTYTKGDWTRCNGARDKLKKQIVLYNKVYGGKELGELSQAEEIIYKAVISGLSFVSVGIQAGNLPSAWVSMTGASKSDFKRVVNNALGSHWLKPNSTKAQAATKAGTINQQAPIDELEAIERLEVMSEPIKAPKIRVKYNKILRLQDRRDL